MKIHLHLHEVCCCESREVWLLACVVQVTLTRKGEDLPGIKELEFSPMNHHLRVTVLVRVLAVIDVPCWGAAQMVLQVSGSSNFHAWGL